MERQRNLLIWIGFLVTLGAFLSYYLFFDRYPLTRDFPWVNLLLFAIGGYLLIKGLQRAFRQSQRYRGKISGSVFAALSLLIFGFFGYLNFYFSKQLPPSNEAPHVGQKAPAFTLPDKDGNPVSLADLLTSPLPEMHANRVTLADVLPAALPGPGAVSPVGVLLALYRCYVCPFCNSELRSFEQHLADFNQRRIRLVAISVDSPEINRQHTHKQGYTYTFLSDPEAEVIRRYDLLHPGAGPEGHDIARPAEFLLDSTGTVRWVNLTDDYRVRLGSERALKVVDQLGFGSVGER